MQIAEIAEQINARSVDYRMGLFQFLRKELKGLSRIPSYKIFTRGSIFERYAFHWGGRTELQYNIGLDYYNETMFFRHGVAFSLEPSSSYPDLVDRLRPKVERFNEYVRESGSRFPDMQMWYWYRDKERSENYAIRQISGELVERDYFIFIGKLTTPDRVNVDDVLGDFDRLLDMYEYVEGSL